MENPQAVGGYRLDVTNFGPIVRANVDLRPLTVFIGPSNTGKSYLAVLIYALHLGFGGSDIPPYRRGFLRRAGWPMQLIRPGASIRKSLRNWLSQVEEDSFPALPMDVVERIRSTLEKAQGLHGSLEREIRRCFGVDRINELARYPGSQAAAVGISIPQNGTGTVQYQLGLGPKAVYLSGHLSETILPAVGTFSEAVIDQAKYWALEVGAEDVEENDLDQLFIALTRSIFGLLLRPVLRDAHYLPADRTGVMHSHQVVVSALAQNATMAGLEPSRTLPMLSGVLADFLSQLISMSGERHRRRKTPHSLETYLERNILGGSIQLDRAETGYPTFAYHPSGWKEEQLPLMRASSMVSELAPVVLYLRHIVRPGNVLIIEEPEAHLHPAMQTAFAREIARLVRSGVRIVMTTHSEWLLEKIGNLVRLSALPEKKRTSIESEEVALSPHEVGAWLFKRSKRPKGSVVDEVKLDPETGLFPTDYSDVSETLYNEGAQIFNRLQEGDEE